MANDTTRAGRQADPNTTQESALPKGVNYLFAIGIDDYEFQPKLYNAVKDAKDVLDVLTNRYQFSTEGDCLITLFNEEATQKNIFAKLDYLSNAITNQDNLLIYFSGHGEFKKNIDEGFWIPFDGEPGNIGSYLSFSLLKPYIKAIQSFHTLIIADSCYAGSLFAERRTADVKTYLESIPSRWLLTAGRNEVVADGKQGDNSPFADAVLFRLKNNQEERLRVSDFCNYVIVDVGNNATQVPRGAPLHGVGDRGGEFMFRLKAVATKIYPDNLIAQPDGGFKRGGEDEPDTPLPPKEEPAPTIQNIGDLKKRLKKLFAEAEFEKAFDLFNKAVHEEANVSNTLISLQGQFNSTKRQIAQGTASEDSSTRTFNRIRIALIEMADKLEMDDLDPAFFPKPAQAALVTTLTQLERQGIEKQIEILQKKLNFFKVQEAKTSDTAQLFTIQQDMEEIEKQINDAKGKLGI